MEIRANTEAATTTTTENTDLHLLRCKTVTEKNDCFSAGYVFVPLPKHWLRNEFGVSPAELHLCYKRNIMVREFF